MRELTVVLTLLAVAWAAVGTGAWWLLARRGRPVAGLVAGVAAIASVAVASAVVGAGAGFGQFAVIHGWYLAGALSVPLLGSVAIVTTLVRTRHRVEPAPRIPIVLGAVLVLPALVGIYTTHIAPFRLRVEHVRAPVLDGRSGDDVVRIAVLADIQTVGVGDLERRAIDAAMAADPDIVLVPGDVFQADGETLRTKGPAMRELLSQLHAPGGVFVVGGDADSAERLAVVLPPTVTLLEDRVEVVDVGDREVAIGGTLLAYDGPGADRVRSELMAQPESTIRILLSHRPDTVLALPADADVDLTVAGHTHGGQISLPIVGPLITLTDVPRAVAAGGLNEVHGNRVYVSAGIGMERGHAPQVRFGVPPTVGIVDLGRGRPPR